jgi:serine acetyltransferase
MTVIGEGGVVGAGSVVRRDVPPRTVVAGNPARPVRSWTEAARMSDYARKQGLTPERLDELLEKRDAE